MITEISFKVRNTKPNISPFKRDAKGRLIAPPRHCRQCGMVDCGTEDQFFGYMVCGEQDWTVWG